MFLNYIFALPESGKRLLLRGRSGLRFQGRRLTCQFLFGCCSPLSNAHGRAAYWLNAALVLVVICSAVAVLYLTSGIGKKRIEPTISLDQEEVRKPAQRYKIPIPGRDSLQFAPGSLSDTVAHKGPVEEYSNPPSEAFGGQAPTPLERSVKSVRLAGPAGADHQQKVLSPRETEKRPAKEVERAGSIASREDVDPKLPADEKTGSQGIAPGPGVTAKAEKGSSRKVDKAAIHTDAEAGKRLFVKVQVANVREKPSTKSRVKFRLEMGDPVTVTNKRGGWGAVKLDDGRFGWVYHTLLADSIVPQKATGRATREIKAIRAEVISKDVAKVIFELNGPFSPQTMIVEGEKPRVVCDFFDAGLASDIGNSIEINNGIVAKIRTGIHKWPKIKVRVVLDLVPERNYEIDQFFFEKENYYVLVVKAKE